jgi:hypothetical protein
MSDEKSPSAIKCDQYGITFTTQQNKDEHMKLEHEEGLQPTSVA